MEKRQKRIVQFLSLDLGLTLLWFYVYERFILPWGKVDDWLMENIAFWTCRCLQALGFSPELVASGNTANLIFINGIGTPAVRVESGCDGLDLMVLFLIFIVVFSGKQKAKLWFIPAGILAIHVVNIIRITILAIINNYDSELMQFNHKYTFTVVVYVFIFVLWYVWINKFSGLKKTGSHVA